MIRVGDVLKVTAGQAAPKEFSDSGVPFIRAGHLEELLNGSELHSLPKVSAEVARNKRLKLLPEGSILFAKSGMSATKNRVYITSEDAYFVSHLAAILPDEKVLNSYLARFLSWYNPAKLILDSAYPSIRLEDINNLKIPLPPIEQQKKIAAILDAADAYRQKTKALIAKYDELTQSLFLDMFGDPVTNPKGWEIKSFEEMVSDDCPLTYGIVQPGDEINNGVPCVRPVDLTKQYVSVKPLKKIEPQISNKFKRTILKGGEILLSVRGSVGVISIADMSLEGSNVTRGIVPIWFNSEVSNKLFFYYLYKSIPIQRKLSVLAKGATLIQLNLKDLRELKLIKPSIELQNQFAESVQAIETQKNQAQASLEKAEELFASLLQRAFKGELSTAA